MPFLSRRAIEQAIVVAAATVCALPFVLAAYGVELSLLDVRFAVSRAAAEPDGPRQMVIVLADTESEERLGRPIDSSWREFYPRFIELLEREGARALIWDSAFVASEPDYDDALASRIALGIPVVAGEDQSSRTVAPLRKAFSAVGWLAFVGNYSVPRRIPAIDNPPPLSWIAAHYLAGGPGPDDNPPESERWIDYSSDLEEIPVFSMADVLESDGERLGDRARTPASVFRNRVVFIGQSLPSSDRYALPGTNGLRVPGVYAQVAASLTFTERRAITRVPWAVDWMIAAVAALLLSGAWALSNRLVRTLAMVLVAVVCLVMPVIFFSAWRIWISYSAVIVSVIVSLVGVGVTRRMWLMRSYRTSLGFDPELIQRHRKLIESYATGIEREAVVLCSDVRDYTQFVTDHRADAVQQVMSDYLSEMESVVDAHGGYVNKYVGDEIVAVFGFPRNEDNIAQQAVRAALAMLTKLDELKERWRSSGLPALEAVGIGLDMGLLRFTHVGGRNRVQFDIIGNPINGASRLQMLTKVHKRALILPAELVEVQDALQVVMYGAPAEAAAGDAVTFIGEVMIRGQGRRRVYGLA